STRPQTRPGPRHGWPLWAVMMLSPRDYVASRRTRPTTTATTAIAIAPPLCKDARVLDKSKPKNGIAASTLSPRMARASSVSAAKPNPSEPDAVAPRLPLTSPPTTSPAVPLQIPRRPEREARHGSRSRRPRDGDLAHKPDAVPAAVAALLAITSIP